MYKRQTQDLRFDVQKAKNALSKHKHKNRPKSTGDQPDPLTLLEEAQAENQQLKLDLEAKARQIELLNRRIEEAAKEPHNLQDFLNTSTSEITDLHRESAEKSAVIERLEARIRELTEPYETQSEQSDTSSIDLNQDLFTNQSLITSQSESILNQSETATTQEMDFQDHTALGAEKQNDPESTELTNEVFVCLLYTSPSPRDA